MSIAVQKALPSKRKWNLNEYHRMGDIGLFEDQRVELIDGEVFQMSPIGVRHSAAVKLLTEQLWGLIPSDCHAAVQNPMSLGDLSEPEPDFAVVEGSPRDYLDTHPKTALLVVEVSDTSLEQDRRKSNLYASAGVPEYWIVHLP